MKKLHTILPIFLVFCLSNLAMAYTVELDPANSLNNYVSLGDWNTDSDFENWTTTQVTDPAVYSGSITGVVSGNDMNISLNIASLSRPDVRISNVLTTGTVYEIRMRFDSSTANGRSEFFPTLDGIFKNPPIRFASNSDSSLPNIPTDGLYHVYRITLEAGDSFYFGKLDAIRFDMLAEAATIGETFEIDYFRIANVIPNPLTVDGTPLNSYTSLAEWNEWNYSGDLEKWYLNAIINSNVSGGVLSGEPINTDPWILKTEQEGLPLVRLSSAPYAEFCLKLNASVSNSSIEIFFGTKSNLWISGDRRIVIEAADIPHDGQFHIYRYDMSRHSDWNSLLQAFRLDPYTVYTTNRFEIDYIHVGDVNVKTFSNQYGVEDLCADPFILKYEGMYYLYCTSESYLNTIGIPVFKSKDMITWEGPCGAGPLGLALHKDDVWGEFGFWSGDVAEKNGKFYMYATAEEHLIVAVSDSPLGPFTQTVKQPMHSYNEIDGGILADDNGKYYLYSVRYDNGNVLYVAELNDDMLTIKESTLTHCLTAQAGTWERMDGNIIEGAYPIKHNGIYYIIYTANNYTSPYYAMGYATSTSPLGPWTRYSGNPILQHTAEVNGPGNGMLVNSPDDSEMFIAYHTHYDLTTVSPRKLALDRAWFAVDPSGGNDILVVNAPTVTSQPYPSATTSNISSYTVAYWRFEQGTNGEKHTTDLDNFYIDSSGNNNNLSSWSQSSRPTSTNDKPFVSVPQTSKQNNLALDFTPNNDLGTFGVQTGSKMIEKYLFNNGWTVECSFKLDDSNWQVLIGKDGRPNVANGEPIFSIKYMSDSGKISAIFYDNATNFTYVTGTTSIQLGEWYNVAVTYNGFVAKLYLKKETDSNYNLEATATVLAGAALGQWYETWTVGRGMWNGAPTDFVNGRIDEIRICKIPLKEDYFLASKNIVFPFVNITNANTTVANEINQYTIVGTNNAKVTGTMLWENQAATVNGSFSAVTDWSITIPLDPGENIISVSGTNIFGDVSNDSVTITRALPEPGLFIIYNLLFIIYYRYLSCK